MEIDQNNYANKLGYDNKVNVTFEANGSINVEIDNTYLIL